MGYLREGKEIMTLAEGNPGNQYRVTAIHTEDDELENFLLTLGCYPGESLGLVSRLSGSVVITIKDGRYTIDQDLANAIVVE